MKITRTDKIVAYLALISGLSISAVAVYYSVAGLVSIFAAAVVPIIVMGVALEVSKLIATIWLKLNWSRAPFFIKAYMSMAVAILMIITSMGIFGFLSKAHSDAGLVSGDVLSKIAVYDEKIKTSKDNIDANRKALKQMDEAVDQVMGRSTDEKGADKAVAIRRGQQKERARLQAEITAEQKTISKLSEERAPIAAEVRKVEAEVGPIKYIANFIYGDNPETNVLEKAVTWVIIIIVIVFDPLAVILLLASQYSFQWFRQMDEEAEGDSPVRIQETEQPTVTQTPVEDFKFLAEYEELHAKYPKTDDEVDELAEAKRSAKEKVIGKELADITTEPAFKQAVDAGVYNPDGTLIATAPTFNELSEADIARLEAGLKLDFAPPGTPGEAWAVSEQQPEVVTDNILKANKDDLLKQKRSRGWFQAVFPKRDDV
jgi:hypothetical protein